MERAIVDPAPIKFGTRISEHSLRREYRTLCALLAMVGIVTASVTAAIGIYRWYFAYRHYGPAAVARWSGPAIGVSAGFALIGLVGLACLLHLRGRHATVYSGGILVHRRGKALKIAWDQIQAVSTSSVRYGLPWLAWGSSSRLSLRLKHGKTLSFTQAYTNLDQMAVTVKQQIYPALLEEYRQALQEGHAVQFGAIEISRTGLSNGKRQYEWADVSNVSLKQGVLRVRTHPSSRKRGIRLSTHRIPNVDLCFQLIQHFLSEEVSKAQALH